MQPRLNVLILPLILKRNEGGFIVILPLPAEDVKFLLPYLVAVIVKCLQMGTVVIGNDWRDNETDFGSVENKWGIYGSVEDKWGFYRFIR